MKQQLYEVEIKSQSLLKEGKKSLVTYFQGGLKRNIVLNVKQLYPQYTNPQDNPIVLITPISKSEYEKRLKTNVVNQKKHLIDIQSIELKEDAKNEVVGNPSPVA
jgi:hypothetical protein